MEDLIQRLDKSLKQNRPDYYQNLLPGIANDQIFELERKLGASLPDEFKAFYSWKNGQSSDQYDSFIFNFSLMSLEEIGETIEMLNELLEFGEFDRANWWNRKWLPFLSNSGGDHWCIDLDGSFNGKCGQIIWFLHDDESRTILFESFYQWLETIVITYEEKIIPYDEEELEDYEERNHKYKELYRKNNPGYPIYMKAV